MVTFLTVEISQTVNTQHTLEKSTVHYHKDRFSLEFSTVYNHTSQTTSAVNAMQFQDTDIDSKHYLSETRNFNVSQSVQILLYFKKKNFSQCNRLRGKSVHRRLLVLWPLKQIIGRYISIKLICFTHFKQKFQSSFSNNR